MLADLHHQCQRKRGSADVIALPAPCKNLPMDAALWYASKMFWLVFPCHSIRRGRCTCRDGPRCKSPGKHPRWMKGTLEHGSASASKDEEIIRRWWMKWPDANVGMATGAGSGVWVFDEDPRHGGDDSRHGLEKQHGKLPETLQDVTGGKGTHRFFLHPGVNVKNEIAIAPGIDVRGDGGLVILPPSGHISGNAYVWDGLEGVKNRIATAPKWLLDIVCEAPGARKAPQQIPNVIPDGAKHKTCVSLAGSMRRRGCNSEEIFAALLKLSERFESPVPEKNLWDIAIDIEERYSPEAPTMEAPVGRELPAIQINARELRDVSADALAALQASNDPPKLFTRGASIVRVDESVEERPLIVKLTDRHLIGEMTRAANYFRLTMDRHKAFHRNPTIPPLDAAKDLLTRPIQELQFPMLIAIAESPFLRPDGTVVSQPGYDEATRTYYKPYGTLDGFAVSLAPTAHHVDAARELILEVFCNFPFVDAANKANALALFITPELRPAINGPVPMALIDAPQAGTGKGLLVECVHIKTTGMSAVMKPAPARNDESEWRKTLTATIERARILTVFDNIETVLDSSSLALALTATSYEDRILGKSENTPPLPQRLVFVMTGNNLALGGDLPRRCYWIRIDAQESQPWLRKPEVFKHPDLRAWVHANRGRLLSAVLTLGRAWFLADCPPASTPILGTFEEWSRIVGGVLAFCGVDGFLGNLDDLYEKSDPSQAAWASFLAALKDKMPSAGFKAADLTNRLKSDPEFAALLPEDLGELDPPEKFQRRLGNALRKREKRRYGDRALHVARFGTHQGATIWTVLAKDTLTIL
jgi:hypothetical protein